MSHSQEPLDPSTAPEQAPQARGGAVSRRRLLARGAVAGAAIGPLGLIVAQSVQAAGARRILAPAKAASPAKQVWTTSTTKVEQSTLTAHVAAGFLDIQSDENAHVALLKSALGSAARPEPTFTGLSASSVSQFAQMSMTFENVGVGAYIFGAGAISSKSTLTTAAGILAIEARHAGFIDILLGNTLSPNGAVDKPLTQSAIVTDVSPFIVSLNGGPSPSGTLANDTDILNFALLLEYLEASFYNMNVPQFFGSVGQG